ncbi:MAG: FHA domain-containing protein [Firmicutes bacterium]|nr:FHA domain-containing protein [Bacillota bacterium]MCM1400769.1 FHA domain-containing protein [Bacteroides sp.]MCM1477616.1 FHA domain-containing protein [Bacteroides sp.]
MKIIERCPACGLEVAFESEKRSTTLCPRCEMSIGRPEIRTDYFIKLDPVNANVNGLKPILLKRGTHTLGRKSSKSTASVQIDVQDYFMSKRHTQLAITLAGNELKVNVRDAGSSNGTFVNERRLAPGEEQQLHYGDTLRMGNTSFTLSSR